MRSGDAAGVNKMWTPRTEHVRVFGPRYFDVNLNEFPYATDKAWLEVCLVRPADLDERYAQLQVRTRFELYPKGRASAMHRRVIELVGRLQNQLASECGLAFAPLGKRRRYVISKAREGGLVARRGYGSINQERIVAASRPRYQAYVAIARVYHAGRARRARGPHRRQRSPELWDAVSIVEDVRHWAEQNELEDLFGSSDRSRADCKPVLDERTVARVLNVVDGVSADDQERLERALTRLIAEELSPRFRVKVDTAERVIRKALHGGMDGLVTYLTEEEARAYRARPEAKRRPAGRRSSRRR